MRKTLLSLLFGISLIGPVSADTWEKASTKTTNSIVKLYNIFGGTCTGTVINAKAGFVLTKHHCDPLGIGLLMDDKIGNELFRDDVQDLLVLHFDEANLKHDLKLSKSDGVMGEDILAVGYGLLYEPFDFEKPIVRHGIISQLGVPIPGYPGPFTVTDFEFVSGQSGGPVVNNNAEVLGLIDNSSVVHIGSGMTPASMLRKLVGQYWRKK